MAFLFRTSRLTQKCLQFGVRQNYTYTSAELEKMTTDEWAAIFKKETIDVAKMDIGNITYTDSANRMRKLLKSGILRHDDIIKKPERFFLAHRLLAFHSPQLGPGFWIRFTVHYNLCMGSIVGLGSDEQVTQCNNWQKEGYLGCFSLTEKFAGVNSGLVVNTIVDYNEKDVEFPFTLHTPNHGAKKNWISQGLVADKTTVVADLRMNDTSLGPHAFMINLRDPKTGDVIAGITHGDMGKKTVGNDLDNAWIGFNSIKLPKNALLNRYADIVDGKYVQKEKNMPVFHMIGQRLFTGRVAVAQAALEFRKRIFEMTKQYTDDKKCWSPSGEVSLTSIPQLKSLYKEADTRLQVMESFVSRCEEQLTQVLKANKQPSLELVEAIAVAKVKAVEDSIYYVHKLKNEVGSYALMAQTGFDQTDFLTCCKFAEGDSRVLMQKMSRDRMRIFSKSKEHSSATAESSSWDEETKKCFQLQKAMNQDIAQTGDKVSAWDNQWEVVYELAEAIMNRIMTNFMKNK